MKPPSSGRLYETKPAMAVSVRRAPASAPRATPPPIPSRSAVTTRARQRALNSTLQRNQMMPTLAYSPLGAIVAMLITIIQPHCG
jgi:hypothetical protein